MPSCLLSKMLPATPKTTTNWRQRADEWYRGDVPDALLDEAVARLEAGNVTQTQYGIRVGCNAKLGDKRVKQWTAYWPQKGCKCFAKHTGEDLCSHELAADIYELEHGANGGAA